MEQESQDGNQQQSVQAEQLGIVVSQLPSLSSGNVLGTAILVFLYHDKVAPWLFWGWVLVNLALVAVVAPWLVWRYRRSVPVARPQRWMRAVETLSFLRAVVWGLLPLAFYQPGALEYQLVNFIFVVVGVSMALMLSAPSRRMFLLIVPPILAPVALLFLFEGGEIEQALALGCVFYGLTLYRMFGRLHAVLLQNIALKHEKIALSAQLQTQKQAAEEASFAKSRFLAAASHDLRQPLHAQSLFVEELMLRTREPGLLAIMQKLQQSMAGMRQLFDELMDVNKLDAGAVPVRQEVFCLRPLLASLRSEFAAQAKQRGLTLRVVPSRLCVRSDRQLLARVLRNLLSNALRYTQGGGVLIGCRRCGDSLRIDVLDTGRGIPQSEQRRVFQEFYRLPGDSDADPRGLGLGLSIVQRLCDLLDSRLELDSAIGRGSRFSVWLPRVACPRQALPAMRSSAVPADGIAGCRVLVVDDDGDVTDAMHGLLTAWGCAVTTAHSAAAALQQLDEAAPPDFVIVDFRLAGSRAPVRNGVELVTLLRRRLRRQLPAIIVSGETGSEIEQLARQAAVPLLCKPLAPARLRALLASMLATGS